MEYNNQFYVPIKTEDKPHFNIKGLLVCGEKNSCQMWSLASLDSDIILIRRQ